MGKLNKSRQCQSNKSSPGINSSAFSRPKKSQITKRYLQLKRKIITLENEQISLEAKNKELLESLQSKNKELLESLQSEKMAHASTRKELFRLNRLYHEATIKVNSFKVKEDEMSKSVRSLLKESDSCYPLIVQLTQVLAKNKTVMQAILSSLPPPGVENLPLRQPENNGVSDEIYKENEKRMKQRVGPMVRGLLITKPKIMLERLMLPTSQEQEPTSNETSIEETNNQLTPIQEENEHNDDEDCLRHISMRPKRKIGGAWKTKRQEKMEKNRREKSKTSALDYENDSSDSESNSGVIKRVEPVVRFKDVSRLLQNSSLMTVDLPRSVDGTNGGTKFSRQSENESCGRGSTLRNITEDPLEGSSWMFNNANHHNFRPLCFTDRRSSLLKSPDSNEEDEEREIAPQCNISDSSLMNSLVAKNNTFIVSTQRTSNSFHSDVDEVSSDGSLGIEPDSTNNIEIQQSDSGADNCSNGSYLSLAKPTSNFNNNSPSQSLVNSMQNSKRYSNDSNLLAAMAPKSPSSSQDSSSKKTSRSSFFNDLADQNGGSQQEIGGKRIRKPKKHLYPGEESDSESKTSLRSKRASLPEKKVGKKSLIIKKKKTSMHTPRNSDTTPSGSADSRPTRNKKNICYKESPLNVKQRRP